MREKEEAGRFAESVVYEEKIQFAPGIQRERLLLRHPEVYLFFIHHMRYRGANKNCQPQSTKDTEKDKASED
jgi:hypothetical protein